MKRNARFLQANLCVLAEMIEKKISENKIITFKCEMFLDILQQYLDLELKLEDTIDTIKDNDNPEAFLLLMVQECQVCIGTKNRNQVRCYY